MKNKAAAHFVGTSDFLKTITNLTRKCRRNLQKYHHAIYKRRIRKTGQRPSALNISQWQGLAGQLRAGMDDDWTGPLTSGKNSCI